MTIQEVIRSDKPFRRKSRVELWGWIWIAEINGLGLRVFENGQESAFGLSTDDILADDWEAKP